MSGHLSSSSSGHHSASSSGHHSRSSTVSSAASIGGHWAPLHSREILTLARAGGLFESKSCDSLLEPDTDVETEAEDGVTCHETSGHVTCHETSGHVTCHDTSGHVSLLPAEGRDCSGQQYKVAPTYCRCYCAAVHGVLSYTDFTNSLQKSVQREQETVPNVPMSGK